MPGNAQQPPDDGRLSRERVELLERHEEHVLDDVLRKVRPWREPARDVRVHRVGVSGHELAGGFAVLLEDGGEQSPLLRHQRVRFGLAAG